MEGNFLPSISDTTFDNKLCLELSFFVLNCRRPRCVLAAAFFNFSSTLPAENGKKKTGEVCFQNFLRSGGGRWIRTTEGIASRFTV